MTDNMEHDAVDNHGASTSKQQSKKIKHSSHKRSSSSNSKANLLKSNAVGGRAKRNARKEGSRCRERTNDRPVKLSPSRVDEDEEDDELLLTSKGWDWDPVKGRRMTML